MTMWYPTPEKMHSEDQIKRFCTYHILMRPYLAFCGLCKLEEDRACHKLFDYNSKKHGIVYYNNN